MTRNLKVLGLTLVAAFAMSAVGASGAQALKMTTGASPVWLTSNQIGLHRFAVESSGPEIECTEARFASTVTNGSTALTVVPTYSSCLAFIGVEGLRATVTMNDCDYLFHGGMEATSVTFIEGEVDLKCPTKKVMEVHIYKNVAETEELCTLTIAEQSNRIGNEFSNGPGEPNYVTVKSHLTFNITRDGSLLCGKATNSAVYEGTMILKAYEDIEGTMESGTVKNLFEGNWVSLTASK